MQTRQDPWGKGGPGSSAAAMIAGRDEGRTDPAEAVREVVQSLTLLAGALCSPAKEPGPVFDLVVRHAALALKADAASLYLRTPDGSYELSAVYGRPFERRRIPEGRGVVGEVARLRQLVVVEETASDPRYREAGTAHREGFRSMVAAPLVLDGELLGALGLYWGRRHSPSPAEQELARLFALYAAAAVRIARLVGELDRANRELHQANRQIARAACRDPLTGLFNRATFWAALEAITGEAGAGSDRGGLPDGLELPRPPIAVVIIDLDGFKEVNDTHGHLAGDAVLQEVAVLLRGLLPDASLVARYGGDEFGVLVAEAVAGADAVAHTLKRAVAEHRFSGGHRLRPPSVGYARYPADARQARELVALADSRMYLDKAGRWGPLPGASTRRHLNGHDPWGSC